MAPAARLVRWRRSRSRSASIRSSLIVALGAVAVCLCGVVADDEALALDAEVDLLDAEVVAHAAVAALAGERGLRVGGAVAHPLAGDPVAPGAGQVAQVLVRGEAAVDDPDAAAEPPALKVVLDLLDHGLVVRVARPDPHPDRDPLARDRKADHDLRQIGAVVLGVPERPEPRSAVKTLLGLVALEVGRGRVEEQQVDLEVQQVGDREEDRLLHPGLAVGRAQHVHRPVGLVLVHPGEPRDVHVVASPVRGRELRDRLQRPVGNKREQDSLDIGLIPPHAERLCDRLRDPQPPPQRVEHERPAERPRADHLEPLARRLRRVRRLAIGVARDRPRQPPEPLDIELVLAAEVQEHLRPRHPAAAAVVGELHVADHRPVLALPLRPPQVHAHTANHNPRTEAGDPPPAVCPRFEHLGTD